MTLVLCSVDVYIVKSIFDHCLITNSHIEMYLAWGRIEGIKKSETQVKNNKKKRQNMLLDNRKCH